MARTNTNGGSGGGSVNSVTASLPLTSSGGANPNIAINQPVADRVWYTGNSNILTSDADFWRDSTTHQFFEGRDFTSFSALPVNTAIFSMDNFGGSGISGTVLQQASDEGQSIVGVIDLSVFSASTVTAGIIANDDTGDIANQLLLNAGSGIWIFSDASTGDTTALSLNLNGFQLTFADNGTAEWGFGATPSQTYWESNNIGYNLPKTTPSSGEVMGYDGTMSSGRYNVKWVAGSSVTPGGSDTQVQFNDGGTAFGGATVVTYDKLNKIFKATNAFSGIVTNAIFTGSGLNDITTSGGPYTGLVNHSYRIVVESTTRDIAYTGLVGTGFTVGDTISFTGSVTTTGQVISDTGTSFVITINATGGIPTLGDTANNGAGTTATVNTVVNTATPDTYKWYKDNVLQGSNIDFTTALVSFGDGAQFQFGSTFDHTIGDAWTFYGVMFQNSFLINKIDLTSLNGGFPAVATGSAFFDGALGINVFNGLYQSNLSSDMPLPQMRMNKTTTGEDYSAGFDILSSKYIWKIFINDGTRSSLLSVLSQGLEFDQGGGSRFIINTISNVYQMGDLDNTGNHIKFKMSDADGTFQFLGGTNGLDFLVSEDGGDHLHIVPNRTQMFAGNMYVDLNGATDSFKIYTDTSGTQELFIVDSTNGILSASLGGIAPELFIDFGNETARFGGINTNQGNISFDDNAHTSAWKTLVGQATPIGIDLDGDNGTISYAGAKIETSIRFLAYNSSNGINLSDYILPITGGTGPVTVDLDSVNLAIGQLLIIKDLDCIASTSNITIDANTGKTISSNVVAQTFVMQTDGQCAYIRRISSTKYQVE